MKRVILTGLLGLTAIALVAPRPSLGNLQSQIDELYALVSSLGAVPTVFNNSPVWTSPNPNDPWANNANKPAIMIEAGLASNPSGSSKSGTHALAIHKIDKGRISWLFGDLGASTYGSLIIDGKFKAWPDAIDPTQVNVTDWAYVFDPDHPLYDPTKPNAGGAPNMASMLQLGADVETSTVLRGNVYVPPWAPPGSPPMLLLGLDIDDDWLFRVDAIGGGLSWSAPDTRGRASFDMHLDRVTDGGVAHPLFTLGNGTEVPIAAPLVQGSGSSNYGPALWAISDGDAFDTGDEVCAAQGFSCQGTRILATGLGQNCSTQYLPGDTYLALCR